MTNSGRSRLAARQPGNPAGPNSHGSSGDTPAVTSRHGKQPRVEDDQDVWVLDRPPASDWAGADPCERLYWGAAAFRSELRSGLGVSTRIDDRLCQQGRSGLGAVPPAAMPADRQGTQCSC